MNPPDRRPSFTIVERLHRWAYGARSMVAEHPLLYLPYARLTHRAGAQKVVSGETELVVEGFTRSANTFAVFAFQLAQAQPVRVAHHLHAPAQFVAAARRGVPALLLVREPEGAVLSTVIRQPFLTIRQALKAYARFHRALTGYRDGFVLADFDEVTTDFAPVIHRINQRFGTRFDLFDHSDENVQRVFELVEERSRMGPAGEDIAAFQSGLIGSQELQRRLDVIAGVNDPPDMELVVPRPSRDRSAIRSELKALYLSPDLRDLREEARIAYERLAAAPATL